MPCHPLMCCRAEDCRDVRCPGHPQGAAAYLDEQDRRAAALNAPLPITFVGPEPLLTLEERYGFPLALALVVICVMGLVVLLNWPAISALLP